MSDKGSYVSWAATCAIPAIYGSRYFLLIRVPGDDDFDPLPGVQYSPGEPQRAFGSVKHFIDNRIIKEDQFEVDQDGNGGDTFPWAFGEHFEIDQRYPYYVSLQCRGFVVTVTMRLVAVSFGVEMRAMLGRLPREIPLCRVGEWKQPPPHLMREIRQWGAHRLREDYGTDVDALRKGVEGLDDVT